ncbi:hypothetical protein MKZ38_007463 [Zalerion maritima]|uniref:Uncharacterized protein n=1 Tax=Zalerion maritima TaxID=339359 RepID=A0AAD5RHW9_9PEZI|nr:hypothetical protein MKZ38_007463 [Zalerion maritima]
MDTNPNARSPDAVVDEDGQKIPLYRIAADLPLQQPTPIPIPAKRPSVLRMEIMVNKVEADPTIRPPWAVIPTTPAPLLPRQLRQTASGERISLVQAQRREQAQANISAQAQYRPGPGHQAQPQIQVESQFQSQPQFDPRLPQPQQREQYQDLPGHRQAQPQPDGPPKPDSPLQSRLSPAKTTPEPAIHTMPGSWVDSDQPSARTESPRANNSFLSRFGPDTSEASAHMRQLRELEEGKHSGNPTPTDVGVRGRQQKHQNEIQSQTHGAQHLAPVYGYSLPDPQMDPSHVWRN